MLTAYSVYLHWEKANQSSTVDYFVYWGVVQSQSIKPVDNIYDFNCQKLMFSRLKENAKNKKYSVKREVATDFSSKHHDDTLEANASPLLYTVVGMMSGGDYDADQHTYIIVCLTCFLVSIVMLCRLLKIAPLLMLALSAYFVTFYAPLLSDIRAGSVNQIQLFIIALFIYLTAKSRPILAGVVIGAGIMLKPNILIILVLSVLLAIIEKEYKKCLALAIGVGAGMMAAVTVSSIYFGNAHIWLDFIKSLPHTLSVSNVLHSLDEGNLGLAMLIYNVTGYNISIFLSIFFMVVFFSVLFFSGNNDSAAGHGKTDNLIGAFIAAGIGCATMLLSANLVWLHYYVLQIPLILFLFRPTGEHNGYLRPQFVVMVLLLIADTELFKYIHYSSLLLSAIINISAIAFLSMALYNMWCCRKSAQF